MDSSLFASGCHDVKQKGDKKNLSLKILHFSFFFLHKPFS